MIALLVIKRFWAVNWRPPSKHPQQFLNPSMKMRRLHQLLLLGSGSGSLHLEGQVLPLASMSLVNVPPGAVHAFAFERGTQGWVATLADDLVEQQLNPAGEERRALATGVVCAADPGLATLMMQILAEFEPPAMNGDDQEELRRFVARRKQEGGAPTDF